MMKLLTNFTKNIRNLFFGDISPQLGRWKLKHDTNQCNIYMNNYADPGYHKTR